MTSLIILLWACGALVNLAVGALMFGSVNLAGLMVACFAAPVAPSLLLTIPFELGGKIIIWRRK